MGVKYPIKMIVSDLDDTLLRTDKTISERTTNTLNECRKAGIKVVYATGRGGSAEQKAPAHLFDGRIIMNGAVARIGGDIVYSRLIPYLTARPLLLACHARGLKMSSEISGMHYSNFNITEEWSGMTNYVIVDFAEHDIDAEKLYSIHLTDEDINFIQKNLPDGLHLIMARDNFAQIMHRDATKAKAVAELARLWGVGQDEIAAFGDDLNDIDMLTYAGYGVAMENALDPVKTAAGFICPSNNADGLARWIEENVL